MSISKSIEKKMQKQAMKEVHVDLYQIFKRNSIVNNHCIHLKIFNVTFIRKNTNKTQFKFRVLKTSSIHHRKAYKN